MRSDIFSIIKHCYPTWTLQIASIQLRPWVALLAWKVYAATALLNSLR